MGHLKQRQHSSQAVEQCTRFRHALGDSLKQYASDRNPDETSDEQLVVIAVTDLVTLLEVDHTEAEKAISAQ
jgi:hypothetical protein